MEAIFGSGREDEDSIEFNDSQHLDDTEDSTQQLDGAEENNQLYGPEDGESDSAFPVGQKPKILLMGLRRSGKSSILNVVFHKMSPNETVFLQSTSNITTDDIYNNSCVQFKILDFPGQIDFFDPSFDTEQIFGGVGVLIFVIDAQDDYIDAVAKLGETVSRVYKINPNLKFEVFIHKVDMLTDDLKILIQREIHQRVADDLQEAASESPGLDNVILNSHLTSIFDHSIFEAFSKVVQKLIAVLPTFENLLNIFNTNTGIEKSFLFDINSKIYIATDYSPVDMQSFELCCDTIDIVLDISFIYGLKEVGVDQISYFDKASHSVIRLDNRTVLLLWQVAKHLALVCILREENYDNSGLIEYNYQCFKKGFLEVLQVYNHYRHQEHVEFEQQRINEKLKQIAWSRESPGKDSAEYSSSGTGRSRANSSPVARGDVSSIVGASAVGCKFQELNGRSKVLSGGAITSSPYVPGENRRRSASGLVTSSNHATLYHAGLVPVTESEWTLTGAVATQQHQRCVSERRYRNDEPARCNPPMRPLVQGQIIGGGDVETAQYAASGNTYLITDEPGVVLVNGPEQTHS